MIIQNVLALKTISWDSHGHKFISPSRSDFIWDQNGLATAYCSDHTHMPPGEFCSCGIYATFSWKIAKLYDRRYLNVMLVVEAGGKTILHEYGFRSEQLRFVAAIRQEDPVFKLATMQAADYYNIPIVNKYTGLSIMDMQNVHLLHWYEPVYLERKQAIKLWRLKNEYSTTQVS